MAKFFSVICTGFDEVEVLELLHRRYSNVDLILQMSIEDFCRFIKIAREKETDERIHAQWVSMLPLMSMQQLKYMSYEEYKKQCLGENIDTRPADEIIKELEDLHGQKLV